MACCAHLQKLWASCRCARIWKCALRRECWERQRGFGGDPNGLANCGNATRITSWQSWKIWRWTAPSLWTSCGVQRRRCECSSTGCLGVLRCGINWLRMEHACNCQVTPGTVKNGAPAWDRMKEDERRVEFGSVRADHQMSGACFAAMRTQTIFTPPCCPKPPARIRKANNAAKRSHSYMTSWQQFLSVMFFCGGAWELVNSNKASAASALKGAHLVPDLHVHPNTDPFALFGSNPRTSRAHCVEVMDHRARIKAQRMWLRKVQLYTRSITS